MYKSSLKLFIKKEYYQFFISFIILFFISGTFALLFGLYQKNLQFCQSFLVRASDLNEIIAREKLIGSESTINFELNKLQKLFYLSSVSFNNFNPFDDIKASNCHVTPFGFQAESAVVFGTKKMGDIKVSKKASFEDLFYTFSFLVPLILAVFGALILFAYLNKKFTSFVLNPLTQISEEVRGVLEFKKISSDHLPFEEFINLVNAINKMSLEIQDSTVKIHKLEASAKVAEAAKQVAHDIRSPLSALSMILGSLEQVSEDKRIIIRTAVQRINDIANDLLAKGKAALQDSGNSGHINLSLHLEFLAPLIDSIVSEKRIQFRDKQRIEIESDISKGYGLFANINQTELKRTLSNLINNAVEAFPNDSGKVIVSLQSTTQEILVTIQDNGRGIPEHVLKKLGEQGLSYGKDGTQSGSGLGVYHAKKTIEDSGGKLLIQSQEGIGTIITITFAKVPAPNWFVENLELKSNSLVVSLDDDASIHQIWRERIDSYIGYGLKHLSFTSALEFKNWIYSLDKIQKRNQIYLVDFELLNQKLTGLDIIEDLGINEQSILVTSRFDEESVRLRCEKLGVKLIPKAMAGFVNIKIN
jgi:signal transduction histidine kinase